MSQLSLIRDTYLRFQVLVHETAKFGVIGGLGFLVQFAVQNALYPKHTGPTTAIVVGTVVATVATFLGNRYWAFKHRQGSGLGHETVLFIVFNVLGLLIQTGIVDAVVYGLGHHSRLAFNVASIVGIGIATLFRLFTYRKFVFHHVKEEEKVEELASASR
jgi:putative flippase GtrA